MFKKHTFYDDCYLLALGCNSTSGVGKNPLAVSEEQVPLQRPRPPEVHDQTGNNEREAFLRSNKCGLTLGKINF